VCVAEEEMLDFTCLDPEVLNPVLRYLTGDAGRIVACPCGSPQRAVQVLGRRDGLIKFRGHLLNVADFVSDVDARPGVARSQLVVKELPNGNSVLEVLLLPTADAGSTLAARIREHIVGSAFGPSIVFQRNPHALEVTVVESLIGNDRTGKVPSLVRRAP
jgi:phenylacetate-CoA ligase